MPSIYPTGITIFDALRLATTGHVDQVPLGDPTRDALLHALLESMDEAGIVITVSTELVPALTPTIVAVNATALDKLDYADKATLQTAMDAADFTHPDDLIVADNYAEHGSSSLHRIRWKEGGGGYKDLDRQVLVFPSQTTTNVFRVVIFRDG